MRRKRSASAKARAQCNDLAARVELVPFPFLPGRESFRRLLEGYSQPATDGIAEAMP